ncbi:NTE family protein [Rhodospirillales bacterium URHD0017]|nr:NTE family protein [Rhodospirillales bacterium URHD0017]
MNAMTPVPTSPTQAVTAPARERPIKEQVVLVLQGGGALGAYQAGVYQALMEGGIEPDWVIGTSIGAINGALIAGNEPANRIARLREFWDGVGRKEAIDQLWPSSIFGNALANFATVASGIPGFFTPNPQAIWGPTFPLGIEKASYYSTDPLRETLGRLVDFDCLGRRRVRLSVGAVNVRTSEMRYFDSQAMPLAAQHIMASGALPPAFPAITIEGESYWDGGIYSNTPIEVVLDDVPRRNSLIFSVNVWQPSGDRPTTIQQVMARHKDIQFASRGKSHVARQAQIHRLRHVVRELANRLPPELRADPVVQDLAEYGCGTLMHLVRLLSPRLDGEDHTKDIDFTRSGIERRWQAGHDHARKVLAEKPWERPADTLAGVVIHETTDG